MKKSLRIILSVFLFVFLGLNISFADNIQVIGSTSNKYSESIIEEINKSIKDGVTKYGTNLDILLLGQDEKSCYKETNYIKCSIDNYGLTGNYIWAINIGIKETTGKGDVNSYMAANVQLTRNIINEGNMKSFQESSLIELKNQDYLGASKKFVNLFNSKMQSQCNTYTRLGEKWENPLSSCKINEIYEKGKLLNEKESLENQRLNAERIALENKQIELERLELEKQRIQKAKESAIFWSKVKDIMIKIFFLILGFVIVYYIVKYIIKVVKKAMLTQDFKKLLSDMNDYSKFINNNSLLLDNDKSDLQDNLKIILSNIERYLGNRKFTREDFDSAIRSKERLESAVKRASINKSDLENVKTSIDSVKNINL